MALIFWEWKWIDVLSKQTNNGNLLFANAVNAVIRLLLLFPRDLRIQQSMKLTVINNSCNYVLASPPRRVPLSPRMQFSLNLHGMMHSWSQILTLIALDGLLSYVSGLWTLEMSCWLSDRDIIIWWDSGGRKCVSVVCGNNKSCNFEWRDSIVETRGYIFGC